MITSQRPAQRCFIVFRAEGIEADIPFSLWRLDADLRAAFDETADVFRQLHQRIKAVRLHPQHGINGHSQLIPMGELSLIALPLVIRNSFVLRITNDRKLVLFADLIAELSKILAAAFHIPILMLAIKCR